MTPRILALLLGLAAPAAAQDAPKEAAAPQAAASAVSASFGLRSEYLLGDSILVPITLSNTGSAPVQVPDLSSRPWLVSFEVESADGRTQRRRTAAPDKDPGRTLTLAPRARRFTLLEIPSSGAFPAGEYTLTVTVDVGGAPVRSEAQAIRVVAARPVAGHVGARTRGHLDTAWVHEAKDGYDLYLHQLDAAKPDRPRGHWHLGRMAAPATPMLATASAGDESSRWVVWQQGARDLQLAQIQGTAFRGVPQRLTAPWPKVALAAAPMMDGRGRLSIPLWVPAPRGDGGELRILAFDDRDRPVFRRVTSAPSRPIVRTIVDDAGNAHMLVGSGETVDLYSMRADGAPNLELPVAGRRLTQLGDGERLVDAAFLVLPTDAGRQGGLSVQLAARTATGVVGRLVSMGGKSLAKQPAIPLPEGATVEAVVPGSWSRFGVVAASGGARSLEEATGRAALPADLGGPDRWAVVRGEDLEPALLRLADGAPVTVTPLAVQPRP